MDFDLWWLILVPVLFGLGWIAARVDVRQMLSEHRKLPDSYFRGLNFLLNEEPDRAIDAFIEVAKLDPETVELHFALGSLFRRRGELERAIRVHQNLLQRNDLPDNQRDQALLELAQDYLKAGMLDRAEDGFERLKSTRFAAEALRALIRIYEAEHDWPKAIAAVNTLQGLVDQPMPFAVHYYCEQAGAALAQTPPDLDAAHRALDTATRLAGMDVDAADAAARPGTAPGRVRVALLQARLAALEGDVRAERTFLQHVVSESPDFAGMAAPALIANYRKDGNPADALALLQDVYARYPSQDLFDAIFQGLNADRGVGAAWVFARQALKKRPSLLGLDRLLQAQLQRPLGEAPERGADERDEWISDEDAALVRSLINRHTQRLGRYACRACGFRAKRFYWQCPGCNAWETYLPKRLEELEGS
ncbi:lipopolysaccharide assembly protein LapB [Verticiella sediminum]|uniref:Lipopolysaccharide assembly protein B n=1 Tax=Verticiella sediminum TaxID=1247510 RepID=A0A556AUN2_9BURK|nr:lipopolysaccharide assembly protein LapB [Verticiella sediminum]TSH96652.1 lipopolysaccharide assembly protein LapB [Verticiella sediminum]